MSAHTKAKAETPIIAYKAFDADLSCKGHKYEVGQTYTIEGKPVFCERGFHACENPLDVLNYYDLCGSRFARVTVSGAVQREDDGGKLCGASITIDAELSLPEWIAASVKWVIASCKGGKDERVQAASGYYSQLAATGDCSKLAASGYRSKLAASGYYSQLAATGNYSKLAATGDYSQLAATGDCSKLAATGDCSKLEITGKNGAAAAVGPNSRIRAAAGTLVTIYEYNSKGEPIAACSGFAGKDFPADTWVIAKGGKLVELAA